MNKVPEMNKVPDTFSFSKLYALVLALLLLNGCSGGYTEYVPVVLVVERGDHQLVERPAVLTPEHIEAMKAILNKYNEPYKTIDGKLYIKPSLQRDKDLLWNYTSKAEGLREQILRSQKAAD